MSGSNEPLRILTVSISDNLGGAEKMARDLFEKYRDRGFLSWQAVGYKTGTDADVYLLPRELPRPWAVRWASGWRWLRQRVMGQVIHQRSASGLRALDPWLDALVEPGHAWDRYWGLTDYRFPGTWSLLRLPPETPTVVHCHNLHHGYFDLRALPWLSRQVPVILSLHNAWLLSGLCRHSLDCDRWRTGCGRCPHLDLWQDATASRDGTAANWRRKRRIYARSRLYVTTACRWLMDKVDQSMLAPAVADKRVIPHGVDRRRFHPAEDRDRVRAELGFDPETLVLLFVARDLDRDPSKDHPTLWAAAEQLAQRVPERRLVCLVRGHDAPAEQLGNLEMRYLPWTTTDADAARFYQAADVYVHPVKADTFPLSVLEALSCGTPVVATAVGGIPEQVRSLGSGGPTGATGKLVPVGDVGALAGALEKLLADDRLRRRLGHNAALDAKARFDLERQVEAYLEWYEELAAPERPARPAGSAAPG